MAQDATSPISVGQAGPLVKRASLLLAFTAALNEFGIKSASAAAAATIALPVTATIFVYEVSALRAAQLRHEAIDRVRFEATNVSAKAPSEPSDANVKAASVSEDPSGKLDRMLASRSAMLDTFGDEPSAVAPVYSRIIKQMLKDDDATFAELSAKRNGDAHLGDKAASLHAVHNRLARLVASQASGGT